jgi:hypothetical protein
VIAAYTSLIYVLVVLRRILKCPIRRMIPWGDMLKIAVATVVPGLATWYLKTLIPLPDLVSFFAAGAVYVTATTAVLSWFGLVSVSGILRRLRAFGD